MIIRSSPIGGIFSFAAVKCFDANIAISGKTAKNSNG